MLVDNRIGHVRSELPLVRPVLMEELPVGVDVAVDEEPNMTISGRSSAVAALTLLLAPILGLAPSAVLAPAMPVLT